MILKANQRLSTHLNQSVLRGWLSEELTRSSPYSLNWFVAPTLIPIVSAVQNQLAHQKYNLITMCPISVVCSIKCSKCWPCLSRATGPLSKCPRSPPPVRLGRWLQGLLGTQLHLPNVMHARIKEVGIRDSIR
jgi:hypothetical protein